MIDLNKTAEENFNIIVEKYDNNLDYIKKDFKRKIKFYERTSKGSEKLRTRSGKSFSHRLAIYKKMEKLAYSFLAKANESLQANN